MPKKLKALNPIKVEKAKKYVMKVIILARALRALFEALFSYCESHEVKGWYTYSVWLTLLIALSKNESRFKLPPAIVRGYVNIKTYFSVI